MALTASFEVELLEDTINGGVVAKDRHGMCVRLDVAYGNVEWEKPQRSDP